jgi:hypothetical protein
VSADAGPDTSVRVFAAFLVARAVFGLAYILAAIERLPIFWYAPLEHTWQLAATPEGRTMGWYGLTAAALAAAAVAGGLTFVASARWPFARSLARASVVVSIAHAGALVLMVDFAYFGWTLTHQTPSPWTAAPCRR